METRPKTPKTFVVTSAHGTRYRVAEELATSIVTHLQSIECEAYLDTDAPSDFAPDLAIAVGGDGTMIHAVKHYSDIGVPTFGINAGEVGFLTGANCNDWQAQIERIVSGDEQFVIEERLGLQFQWGANVYGPILNEVFLWHPEIPVHYKVTVNDVVFWEDVFARGMLVATATGSTAQNFSNNGRILIPLSSDVALTPMNRQFATIEPLSLPQIYHGGSISIELLPHKYPDTQVRVSADGQWYTHDGPVRKGDGEGQKDVVLGNELNPHTPIVISRHPQPLLIATFGLQQYKAALQKKLGYAT